MDVEAFVVVPVVTKAGAQRTSDAMRAAASVLGAVSAGGSAAERDWPPPYLGGGIPRLAPSR